jgi:hypothetical protein
VNRACRHDRSASSQRRVPAPQRSRFRDVVELSKDEVFEVCGRLALAHQALVREGDSPAAIELVWVFDLMERRVAG